MDYWREFTKTGNLHSYLKYKQQKNIKDKTNN